MDRPSPASRSIFIGRDDDDGRHAAELAGAVGVRNVAGFLSGGMTSWRDERRDVQRVMRMTVEELVDRMGLRRADRSTCASAWSGPPGTSRARSTLPYHDLRTMPDGIDLARPVAAICASGQRSSLGASLLQRHGGERRDPRGRRRRGDLGAAGQPIERGD